jgi:hypothetical protein
VTVSRRPTRAIVEAAPYLDLQNLARRQQRPTDELHPSTHSKASSPGSHVPCTPTDWCSSQACYFGDGQWGLAGATELASTALGHPRACRQDPAWTVPTERALTTSRTNEVRDCRSGTPTTRRLAVDITSVVDMDDVNPISIFVDLVDDTVATTSGGA